MARSRALVKETFRVRRRQQVGLLKGGVGLPKSTVTVFLCGRLDSDIISNCVALRKGWRVKKPGGPAFVTGSCRCPYLLFPGDRDTYHP